MAKKFTKLSDFDEAFDAGKQAEGSALWDAIQNGGTRTDYANAFKGEYWNANTFKPKYDIRPQGSSTSMFDKFNGQATGATLLEETVDLSELLNKAGVVLDTSQCTGLTNVFYISKINKIPFIDATGVTSALIGTFANCARLHTIEGLKVKESLTYNNLFGALFDLQNLTIYGTIGQNGFDVHYSTQLSKESITSIINALSATTSGLSVTLSAAAVNNAFATDEWNTIIATKPNWTISLM